jgi:DNA-binding response OmpR family regulator
MPRAIIIELNFDNKAESGIQIIELFNKIRETLPPVIFISGEDTLSNRINTIKTGSLAYLPDPVNISALINQLKKGLSNTPVIPDKRILMIDNNDKKQRIFTQAMEYGFDARVLHNPDKLLKSLKIYRLGLLL